MLITSPDNKKIKELVKLKQKKYRDSMEKFIVETEHLIKEAFLEGRLLEVYVLENNELSFKVDVPVYYVSVSVINKLKNISTSKFIGVVSKKESKEYRGKRYLLLDRVSDPGNLGTIMRSAVAFNVDTLIVSLNSCDIYNDKVIRASEGAIFKLNIISEDLLQAINTLKKLDIAIYGTDVKNGVDVREIPKDNFAIIMGNEGAGISSDVKKLVENNIYIKTSNVESLNVAMAASIILYELNK